MEGRKMHFYGRSENADAESVNHISTELEVTEQRRSLVCLLGGLCKLAERSAMANGVLILRP